ncbi:MAG: PIN domain-containing protein [Gammaproteobacteria bacterium]|nr:PIN domain-containing protein [Gammaproteobacteria bacterium]
MPAKRFLIDANLLVLFVVGRTDRRLIAKHRRLRQFSVEDYDRLVGMVGFVEEVVVTPNTLTETSNLLAQHNEPERSRFFDELRHVIENSHEITVASVDACRNRAFRRLGIADAAVLELVSATTPVLTVDLDLFIAASRKDPHAAVNFRHLP